jgi:hypothetical protein
VTATHTTTRQSSQGNGVESVEPGVMSLLLGGWLAR